MTPQQIIQVSDDTRWCIYGDRFGRYHIERQARQGRHWLTQAAPWLGWHGTLDAALARLTQQLEQPR